MPENVRARTARATSALLLTLAFALLCALALAALCSGAASALVGARHQAENATQLDDPTWAIVTQDETSDDGKHVKFKEIADSADKIRFNVTTSQSVSEIRLRVRLSGGGLGDDRLAVWVNGTAFANKVGNVLPPAGPTWATRTIALSNPLPAGSHTIYLGPNQQNDAFIALDWMELHGPEAPPPPPPSDTDGDGVPDSSDNCQAVANAGQSDADDDGIGDACDGPGKRDKRDSDGDGVQNRADRCADTPVGTVVGADGCAAEQPPADSDGDGVADGSDHCPDTPAGTEVNEHGCPLPEPEPSGDTDGDGVADSKDQCDGLSNPARTNGGCPYPQSQDYDFDGILNSVDDITGKETHNTSYGAQNPRIKGHCKDYAVNRVDPIAFTQHLHHQVGNTTTANDSTGQSLASVPRGTTSCNMPWLTSAGWSPVIENETEQTGTNFYYRAPGDERTVQDLIVGIELLTKDVGFRCATDPEGQFSDNPNYNCTARYFQVQKSFPDCIDLRRLTDETTNAVSSTNRGHCPQSHPYRIPELEQLTRYDNADYKIANPMRVSMGVDQWGGWDSMHGDYFSALQPEFNEPTGFGPALIDYCIREGRGAPNGPARCGQEP